MANNMQELKTDIEPIELLTPRRGHIVLTLPNNTTLSLVGDPTVIKQVLEQLDGVVLEYTAPVVAL